MTPAGTLTVRIVRPDRSVTYRCETRDRARAEREAAAWNDTSECTATVVESGSADERAWVRARRAGERYYPDGAPAPEPVPYPAGGLR